MGFNRSYATINVKEGTRLFNNVRHWPLRFVFLSVYLFALYIGCIQFKHCMTRN